MICRRSSVGLAGALLLASSLMVTDLAAGSDDHRPRRAGDRVEPNRSTAWSRVSGCLRQGTTTKLTASETMCNGITIEARDHAIVMHHQDAVLNCCADISVVVERPGEEVILFREQETGELCRCVCPYELEAGIGDLADGTYTVEVHDPQDRLLCRHQVQIGPDRLGVIATGCENDKDLRGDTEERVEITTSANRIVIDHGNALLNCCLELAVEVDATPGYYRITESDRGQECDCLCYFSFVIIIPGVPPGEHLVELVGVNGEIIATANVNLP
jgi:hypothetical protein